MRLQWLVLAAVLAAMAADHFLTRSLWPAIALHAAVDAMGGVLGWLILREPPAAPAIEPSRPRTGRAVGRCPVLHGRIAG